MTTIPTKNWEAVWKVLVTGIQSHVESNGFTDVVLGLSGGMDSALVVALAADALGAAHVHGVLMPSPWSSRGSITDAEQSAKNLGVKTRTIPIAPLMTAFETALAPAFAGTHPDVTEENIQSRIRGLLLMALSNKFGWMVLNTGNKSELSVGYCTLYGDMCGALSPIAELYKTEVYALAGWYNERVGEARIPQQVFDKPPSAELRPDQTDQDSLPSYEHLDSILYTLESCAPDNVFLPDIPATEVQRVATLKQKSA
ncbi:MAG: NAD(+) synthase, partial [Bilophila sp.]